MRGSVKPHLILTNLTYKCIIGRQCQQETGRIPKYLDSERLKIHKQIKKTKSLSAWIPDFLYLKKMGLSTTLKLAVFVNFKISQPTNISGKTEGIVLNSQLSNTQINENISI